MLRCQEVTLCQKQVRNKYLSRCLWLISFYQAIGRQWKQWCSDHKEAKSPTDVVSSYCRTALNFIDFLHISKALQVTLTAKCSFHLGLLENLQASESNCSFTFKLSEKLCVEHGCLSDTNKHPHVVTFCSWKWQSMFWTKTTNWCQWTDCMERTRYVEFTFSRTVLSLRSSILFNATITRKCITVVVCDL